MNDATTIAHLSDAHLTPVAGFSPRYWNAKRALGFVNWQRKRRHVHQRAVLDRLVADIHRHAPDHIAVTGDLIHIGLPTEYHAAGEWLTTVGPPERVSLVPGNHDIYTSLRGDVGIERWRSFMTSDGWGKAIAVPGQRGFPYLRREGRVALIGVNSAVETAPAIATGRVGAAQMNAVRKLLDRLVDSPLLRVVLIHHPPLPGATRPRHELLDAAETLATLAAGGADLVLHGHTHLPTLTSLVRPDGHPLHVLGVASASAAITKGHDPLARYNLLRISGEPGRWWIELERRGLATPGGGVVEIERVVLG